MARTSSRAAALSVALILTAGPLSACSQKMMATPVMFQDGQIDPFTEFAPSQRTNEVTIFYATNRPGSGPMSNRKYGNGVRDELELGQLTARLGSKNATWEELYEASTSKKRRGSWALSLENTQQIAVLEPSESPDAPPPAVRAFTDRINEAIAGNEWKDVTIYIHGANVDFKQSSCTAADFHHFMGRHGVMISFDWPSTQSPLTYGIDVGRAAASVQQLVRFVELLAANTDAEHINFIGYSAGAQVLSPAMYELREKYASLSESEIEKKLRIGEVYFAAPDVDMRTFALTYVPRFYDMAVSTTLTVNLDDGVLGLAQMAHGKSRAGRPDIRELNEEESLLVVDLVNLPTFNVIDMGTSTPPAEANLKGHGYWYQSPWVSTDIIIQFIFHASPAERGLEIDTAPTRMAHVWLYPADYPERVVSRLKAYLATLDEERAVQEAVGRPGP